MNDNAKSRLLWSVEGMNLGESLSTGVENDAIDEDNTLSHLVQIWFSHEPILI